MLFFSAPVTMQYHCAKIGFLIDIGRILLLIFTTFCIFLLATIYTFIFTILYILYNFHSELLCIYMFCIYFLLILYIFIYD